MVWSLIFESLANKNALLKMSDNVLSPSKGKNTSAGL